MRLNLVLPLIVLLVAPINALFAHGEEIVIGKGNNKPIYLSPAEEQLLQITVAPVTSRPMATILTLNGQVQLLPDAQADVSTRISGSITAIQARLGDYVKKGQSLAIVQSRLIGDPPPSVAVKAPIAGIIDARNVNLGQAVEPNTVLFHISDREHLLVIAQVYEEDLGKVKTGQKVNIHALGFPQEIFTGNLSLIEPNLDPLTRTVNVQIRLANKQNLLKPGMFVTADLLLNEDEHALTIPNDALLENNEESFVFVRKAGQYHRVVVKVGPGNTHFTAVLSGLALGDEVVTQGGHQLFTLWLSGGKSKDKKEE